MVVHNMIIEDSCIRFENSYSDFKVTNCKHSLICRCNFPHLAVYQWKLTVKHKHFPCTCAYVYVCAATSESEIPLMHNTSTKIFTTRGYVWPMKILDQDNLAPKQFSKMPECSIVSPLNMLQIILLVLVFASSFVFTWVISIACVCTCVALEKQCQLCQKALFLTVIHQSQVIPHWRCVSVRKNLKLVRKNPKTDFAFL